MNQYPLCNREEYDFIRFVESLETYDDLCRLGKDFIENRVQRHINYLAPFGKGEDANGHEVEAHNLSRLHDLGIVTTHGQCNIDLVNEKQRGNLDFYCLPDLAKTLRVALFRDARIYTIDFGSIKHPHSSKFNFTTAPPAEWVMLESDCARWSEPAESIASMINMTKFLSADTGAWVFPTNVWVQEHPRDFMHFPNVEKILEDKIFFSIVCREYGARTNCSDILLEHVENVLK